MGSSKPKRSSYEVNCLSRTPRWEEEQGREQGSQGQTDRGKQRAHPTGEPWGSEEAADGTISAPRPAQLLSSDLRVNINTNIIIVPERALGSV